MNNDPVYTRLSELAWRRKLTPAEQSELQAWLDAHPEAAAEHALERALNDALAQLPQAPVPSNFTARIQQAIACETQAPATQPLDWTWVWRRLLPRTAVALLVLGTGTFAYHRHREQQRARTGESIVTVLGVTSLPKPEVLEDFDVIRRLDTAPTADQELIALLQ